MESDEYLKDFWKVTSLSTDSKGRDFVASMEGVKYPFMATQFHPEKPTQVMKGHQINRSWESININRYFADTFMQMARANPSTWGSYEDLHPNLIDNSPHIFTEKY